MQFLRHLRGSSDFETESGGGLARFIVGQEDESRDIIIRPYGIAIANGKIFVCDSKGLSVGVMDMVGQQFKRFGTKGRGQLRKPINIRLDGAGNLYVTDSVRRQIVVYDQDGKYLREYGTEGQFKPADVIVTADELYVLDIAAHDIKVYDLATGKLSRTLCKRGPNPGEFNFPTNMVMDGQGNILVCDSVNIRVQKLNAQGEPMMVFGQSGRTPGYFSRPKGIAVDRGGIIYVVDAMLAVVQLFDQRGRPLMFLGGSGTGPGKLYLPTQVVIDYDNIEVFREYISEDFEAEYLILVTNQLGDNKISVFAFGRDRRFPSQESSPEEASTDSKSD